MHLKKTITLGLGMILTVSVLFIPSTLAQESSPTTLTVAPSVYEVITEKGKVIEDKLRIRNNANEPIALKVELKRFEGSGQGEVGLIDLTTDDIFDDWVSFENPAFTAPVQEWIDIPFNITIPETAAFGYYYAFVISRDEEVVPEGGTAAVSGSLAVPILLTVSSENAILNGAIVSFKTNSFYEYLPADFNIVFENKGNVHVKPLGNIFIKDFTGTTIGTLPINKERGSVLPRSQRIFESVWNDSFIYYEEAITDGVIERNADGSAKKRLKFDFQKLLQFRIGRYTAHALVVIQGGARDIPFEASTSFIVFPWKIALAVLFIVIFILFGVYSMLKSLSRLFRRS